MTLWAPNGQKLGTFQLTAALGCYYSSQHCGNGQVAPQFYASPTGTYLYFGGKMIKNANGWVYADRLGSIRKFYPYGTERPSATQNGTEKFTGYLRDAESGNDYAVNRYMQPGMGRFLTADPYRANSGGAGDSRDPASWNRYAYTRGDPVNRVDATGLADGEPGGPAATVCSVDGTDYEGGICDLFWDRPGVPVQTQGGGTNHYTVTGYSRTGANEATIAGVLQKLLDQVLSRDDECSRWLTGSDFSGAQFVQAILGSGPDDYTFGDGQLNVGATAAFVGNLNPDGTPVQGLPIDSSITVNTNGAFFSKEYSVGGYVGGSLQAQAFILLHEIAHEVGAEGFQDDAGASLAARQAQNRNNQLVSQNCGKEIKALQ